MWTQDHRQQDQSVEDPKHYQTKEYDKDCEEYLVRAKGERKCIKKRRNAAQKDRS